MPRRKSREKDSMIKAVEAVRKEKEMGYKLASKTRRLPRDFERLRQGV